MLENMIFGRYIPSDSFVHRLDPRAKLVVVFAFIILVFLANNVVTYSIVVAFVLLVIFISKIRLYFILNGLKPILILMLFTFFLHLFFTKTGDVLLDAGLVTIYKGGLQQGIFISIRFLVLVLMTTVLTLSTSPILITDGLEMLLKPLKKVKFPVHELALMMSIALRFIPTLMDETDKIMKAQMARGSDLSAGPIGKRVKAIIPLLVPLFISAFKRAEDLATAMEVRGYRGGEGRTRFRQLHWTTKDTVCLLVIVALGISLAYLRS